MNLLCDTSLSLFIHLPGVGRQGYLPSRVLMRVMCIHKQDGHHRSWMVLIWILPGHGNKTQRDWHDLKKDQRAFSEEVARKKSVEGECSRVL